MAAWKIAENAHKVIVFDRRKEIGVPIQCGEGLSRYAIETNGIQPETSWIRKEIKGARIFVPNGKNVLVKGEGYAINRAKFDQYLARLAEDTGAEIRLDTMVTGIEREEDDDGPYYFVHTDKEDIEARYVVGADGPHSIVAKWAGIPFKTENVLGYQYKFETAYVEENLGYEFQGRHRLEGEWLDFHYNNRWPNGYIWVFPRGELYNIGICGPGKLKEELDGYCRENGLDPERRIEINAGQIPRGTIIPSFVKDQVLIVGDAAGLTNPLTKGGIHAALFSGRHAGLAITEAVENLDHSLVNKYGRVMQESPFTDPKMMEHGKLIYSLTDEAASFVGDLLNEKDISEFSCLKAIVPIIMKPKIIRFIPRFLKILKALKISSIYGW